MAFFNVTKDSLRRALSSADSFAKFKEKVNGEAIAGIVIGAGLTTGMAFAAAYGQGRFSDIDPVTGKPSEADKFHVANIPVDLLLGAAGLIGALTGMLGKYDHLGASAGSGLLAGNLAVTGYRMGRSAKATENNMPSITETFEAQATAGYPRMYARGVPSMADQAVRNAVYASQGR